MKIFCNLRNLNVELKIFTFKSYVYCLACGFIASSGTFSFPACAFNIAACAFSFLTRGFDLVTRRF